MVLPDAPICPAPLPSVRIETRSSASKPATTTLPPARLSTAVKTTSLSSNCGAAFTVFSVKVTLGLKPVSVGTPSTSVTLMATAWAAVLSAPSEAVTVIS